MTEVPFTYRGWWRIIETSQWDDSHLDVLGLALLSLTGSGTIVTGNARRASRSFAKRKVWFRGNLALVPHSASHPPRPRADRADCHPQLQFHGAGAVQLQGGLTPQINADNSPGPDLPEPERPVVG
jgi:hypothetical protein